MNMKKYGLIAVILAVVGLLSFMTNWGFWNLLVPKVVDYDSPLRRVAQCASLVEVICFAGAIISLGIGMMTQNTATSQSPSADSK